jgi:hypothetical protein
MLRYLHPRARRKCASLLSEGPAGGLGRQRPERRDAGQATGAEQISEALLQLSEASQQTVDSLRQSNEAIGGLNQVATDLRGAVSRFALQTAS